uniref:Uncharacterized protein n=1 Tax=Arundo donax TaxID=35708 RepID=A0A0A9QMD8_ARUDO
MMHTRRQWRSVMHGSQPVRPSRSLRFRVIVHMDVVEDYRGGTLQGLSQQLPWRHGVVDGENRLADALNEEHNTRRDRHRRDRGHDDDDDTTGGRNNRSTPWLQRFFGNNDSMNEHSGRDDRERERDCSQDRGRRHHSSHGRRHELGPAGRAESPPVRERSRSPRGCFPHRWGKEPSGEDQVDVEMKCPFTGSPVHVTQQQSPPQPSSVSPSAHAALQASTDSVQQQDFSSNQATEDRLAEALQDLHVSSPHVADQTEFMAPMASDVPSSVVVNNQATLDSGPPEATEQPPEVQLQGPTTPSAEPATPVTPTATFVGSVITPTPPPLCPRPRRRWPFPRGSSGSKGISIRRSARLARKPQLHSMAKARNVLMKRLGIVATEDEVDDIAINIYLDLFKGPLTELVIKAITALCGLEKPPSAAKNHKRGADDADEGPAPGASTTTAGPSVVTQA